MAGALLLGGAHAALSLRLRRGGAAARPVHLRASHVTAASPAAVVEAAASCGARRAAWDAACVASTPVRRLGEHLDIVHVVLQPEGGGAPVTVAVAATATTPPPTTSSFR